MESREHQPATSPALPRGLRIRVLCSFHRRHRRHEANRPVMGCRRHTIVSSVGESQSCAIEGTVPRLSEVTSESWVPCPPSGQLHSLRVNLQAVTDHDRYSHGHKRPLATVRRLMHLCGGVLTRLTLRMHKGEPAPARVGRHSVQEGYSRPWSLVTFSLLSSAARSWCRHHPGACDVCRRGM